MSTGAHLKIRKPSAAQKRALAKLDDTWRCAYELGESLNVLDALVKHRNAEIKYEAGSTVYPHTRIYYRLML